MKVSQLKSQHDKIYEAIKTIKGLVAKKDYDNNAREIAKNISGLAGILNIHLGNEDRFLYPNLRKKGDAQVKEMVDNYVDEMGDFAQVFKNFKNDYNTYVKITNDQLGFERDLKVVFTLLEKRLKKEDTEIYVIAERVE